MKFYNKSPLPFVGQKRNFLKPFVELLHRTIAGDGDGWTIVDVFGGSGLLSHAAKHTKPHARVIYNDFDHYRERVANIADINRLYHQLAAIVGDIPRNTRLDNATKARIINTIEQFDGYVDVGVLQSWLLFSGNQVESLTALYKKQFWQNLPQKPYESAVDYLQGVECVRVDFLALLREHVGKEKTLLILDPPYLCTDQKAYNKPSYFDLVRFLELMHNIKPPFVIFSSSKSEIKRYIHFCVANKATNWQALHDVEIVSVNVKINYNTCYEDNIIYNLHGGDNVGKENAAAIA